MTNRHSSSSILCALAFAFVASPLLSSAQTTNAPAEAPAAPAAPAPAPAPAETNAPVAPAPAAAAPEEHPSTYTVVSHDSLWTIAHKFGTTVVKLRKLNNLKKGALLHPGQVLQIPPATTDAATK